MRAICITVFLSLSYHSMIKAQVISLWPDKIPFQKETNITETIEQSDIIRISYVIEPTLEIFLPTKNMASGHGVIICPGGGYQILAYDHEGTDIAKMLNARGIAAFVLKYRLPNSDLQTAPQYTPLTDAQQAIRLVRSNAEKWNLNASQIGVMGFSAGGHLAAAVANHHAEAHTNIDTSISARPDFSILVYAGDDNAVSVENSMAYYHSLLEHKIPTEMHIYPEGGHGFGLALWDDHLSTWTDRCTAWIRRFSKSE